MRQTEPEHGATESPRAGATILIKVNATGVTRFMSAPGAAHVFSEVLAPRSCTWMLV